MNILIAFYNTVNTYYKLVVFPSQTLFMNLQMHCMFVIVFKISNAMVNYGFPCCVSFAANCESGTGRRHFG